LQLFAGELAGATDGFRLLPDSLLRGFLVMLTELHLAEDAFALHLLLQHLEGLVDIVVTDENLHAAFLIIREVSIRIWTFPVPMATVIPRGDSSQAGTAEPLMISHEAVAEPLPWTLRFAVNTSAGEQ
jgi:hypothetical protein